SAGADALVKVWDVAGMKEVKTMKGDEIAATGGGFSTDGQEMYSIGFYPNVRGWNVAQGKENKKLGPTPDDLYGIALSKDGKLATSGYGGNITLWNLAEGKPTASKKLKFFGAYCIAFTPDGKAVVTGHDNHKCYITPMP